MTTWQAFAIGVAVASLLWCSLFCCVVALVRFSIGEVLDRIERGLKGDRNG